MHSEGKDAHRSGGSDKVSNIGSLVTCWWTARRLQQYLDADLSMPMTHAQIQRLEEHLAECEKCASLTSEYRELAALLEHFSAALTPDPLLVRKIKTRLATIVDGEHQQ